MAKIYEKSLTDKTLILAPREGYMRPFDFGNDWTELRLGLFFNTVRSTDDNLAPASTESVTQSNNADRMTFGLKTANLTLPGYAGTDFLGLTTNGNWEAAAGRIGHWENLGSFGNRLNAASMTDTTVTANARINGTSTFVDGGAAGASDYCGFVGIKFVISNRGDPTQTVTITIAAGNPTGTDYSASALQTAINSATYNTGGAALNWFDGVPAARAIPDAVWLRCGAFNNRIRISAIRAIRYA